MSVNKVILIGNLGKEPEIKNTKAGGIVTVLSLATSETWKDKSGNDNEKTEWHKIVMFNRLAEIARDYCQKGSQVYIEGKLQTSSWEKDGEKRFSTDVVAQNMQILGVSTKKQKNKSNDEFDDDIPF